MSRSRSRNFHGQHRLTHQSGVVTWIMLAILVSVSGVSLWYYLGASTEITDLKVSLLKSERQLKTLEDSAKDLKNNESVTHQELRQTKEQLNKIRNESSKLNKDLLSNQSEVQKLTRQLNDANQQRKLAISELSDAESHLQQMTKRKEELESSDHSLRSQIATQNEAISAFQAKLETAQTVEDQYKQARAQLALQQSKNDDFSSTIDQLELQLQQEEDAMLSLEKSLQQQLFALNEEKQDLVTQLVDGTTVIKLPESILFSSGSADIGESGQHALEALANALVSFPDHLVSVQGHSDSRSISSGLKERYPTNWELSSARAASAVKILASNGINPIRLQAVGLAEFHPIFDETDNSTRQQNRRIEVLLYPNAFQTKELDDQS